MKLGKIKKFLKNYLWISAIIIIFLIFRIYATIKYFSVCYDCSIYLSQAKYIYSLGASGYFEPLRPLVMPIIYGTGWLLHLDIVVFSTTASLLLAAGVVFLVYKICINIDSKESGIFSAIFSAIVLCITPIFFAYAGQILTDIPSTFFALLSFYFFIKKKYWLTGFFASIAFMARFPQGILLFSYTIVFFADFIARRKFNETSKNYTKFILPYFAVLLAYLIFNAFMYSSADTIIEAMFWPFVQGSATIAKSGLWMYNGDLFYYLAELTKQNFLLVLSPLFLYYYFSGRKYKSQPFNFLLITPLVFIAYFTQMPHKELRFALVFLPYIIMLAGLVLGRIFKMAVKEKLLLAAVLLSLALLISFLGIPMPYLSQYVPPSGKPVCDYINSHNLHGTIITSTPFIMPCVDNKIEASFYISPLFINSVKKNPGAAVVYSPESFSCPPNDTECFRLNQEALGYLNQNYKLLFFSDSGSYPIFVFAGKK